jgi:hypothetical protein
MARRNRSQKRSQRRQRNQQRQQQRQQGGATYSVNAVAPIQTASGVPLAVNLQDNTYCSWGDYRPAPHIGGRRRSQRSQRRQNQRSQRQQRGGCGCGAGLPMAGGGGGTGGYGFDFGNNELGKVYASLPVGPCPAQPVATPLTQAGGMAPIGEGGAIAASTGVPPPGSDAALREIVSYPNGFGLGHPYSTKNESAHFLEPVRYERSCMGGGSRKRKSSRKSRKSSKRSRKH